MRHASEVIEQTTVRHARQLQRVHHQHPRAQRVPAEPGPLRRATHHVGIGRHELGGGRSELIHHGERTLGRSKHRARGLAPALEPDQISLATAGAKAKAKAKAEKLQAQAEAKEAKAMAKAMAEAMAKASKPAELERLLGGV